MKRLVLFLLLSGAAVLHLHADFVKREVGGYVTYWDSDGTGDGKGIGAKFAVQPIAFFFADFRASYVDFDRFNTRVLPIEASVNGRFPFIVSPYAGLGAGYYFTRSDRPGLDSGTGYFGQIGADWTIGALKLFGELQLRELNEGPLDGRSLNIGATWAF